MSKVNVFLNNTTGNKVTWAISDGTTNTPEGAVAAQTLSNVVEVTPGTITGGNGKTPNGLIITLS